MEKFMSDSSNEKPFWAQLITGAVIAAGGYLINKIANERITKISAWGEMNESDALKSIKNFIQQSTSEEIDGMDTVLLQAAVVQSEPEMKVKMLKYYTYFKVAEFERFGNFRGFPSQKNPVKNNINPQRSVEDKPKIIDVKGDEDVK
jgi:hypothetical protein